MALANDFGSTVATGGNVQVAIQQIDDYLTNLNLGNTGVQSVTAGDCITVAGTAADPIVSIPPSGITPGTYDGFTVNACGLITGYAPPANDDVVVVGTAPIGVAFNGGTNTYTVSIDEATKTAHGTVELADEANLGGNENLIDGDDAITWDFLQQWANGANGIAQVVAGHDAVLVTFNGIDTYNVQVAADLVTSDGTPIVVTLNPATGKFDVDILPAAVGAFGAVILADPANVATPLANNPTDVITSQYLEDWATARGI